MRKSRKEKRNFAKAEKFYVRVVRQECEHIIRNRDPMDEYDGDDIEWEHNIRGFKIVSERDGIWDFILTENPTGDIWYLVCVFYSTGDSFHREDNCLSLVSFMKNAEDAKAVAKAIKEDYEKYKKSSDHKFHPVKVYLPVARRSEEIYTGAWKGYFEHLSSVDIHCLGEELS